MFIKFCTLHSVIKTVVARRTARCLVTQLELHNATFWRFTVWRYLVHKLNQMTNLKCFWMFSYPLEGQDTPAPWTSSRISEVKWAEHSLQGFLTLTSVSRLWDWKAWVWILGYFFTATGKSLKLSINEDNNTCLRGITITKSTRTTSLVAQTVKVSACNAGDPGSIPGVGKIPWRRKWQPTPVFLPGESDGWRSLVGYNPWGHKESDRNEWLHFHFSL